MARVGAREVWRLLYRSKAFRVSPFFAVCSVCVPVCVMASFIALNVGGRLSALLQLPFSDVEARLGFQVGAVFFFLMPYHVLVTRPLLARYARAFVRAQLRQRRPQSAVTEEEVEAELRLVVDAAALDPVYRAAFAEAFCRWMRGGAVSSLAPPPLGGASSSAKEGKEVYERLLPHGSG